MTAAETAQTKKVVSGLVDDALKSSTTVRNMPPMTAADTDRVADKVTQEVAAVVINQTNQEPWYQSRVTWGAIGAVALPLLGLIGVTADVIEPDEFVAMGVAAGTVFSGLVTLYGRWVARKPLGS